jgi:hypothetical protein
MGVNTAKLAITAVLTADSAFSTPLTGGVYTVGVDDVGEISLQDTPGAFDANSELLPCALVKLETAVPLGPYRGSARQYLVIYVYQKLGHEIIDAALDRAIALLDGQDIPDARAWDISWSDVVSDLPDDVLNASMGYVRFSLIVNLI